MRMTLREVDQCRVFVFGFLDDAFQVPFKRQTIRPSVESLHSLVKIPLAPCRAFSAAFELTVVLTDAFRQIFGGANVIFTSAF